MHPLFRRNNTILRVVVALGRDSVRGRRGGSRLRADPVTGGERTAIEGRARPSDGSASQRHRRRTGHGRRSGNGRRGRSRSSVTRSTSASRSRGSEHTESTASRGSTTSTRPRPRSTRSSGGCEQNEAGAWVRAPPRYPPSSAASTVSQAAGVAAARDSSCGYTARSRRMRSSSTASS